MVSLARRNLFDDIPRFLIAQAGILFAVSLVTIQIGILRGFVRSTTLLINQSKADIWIASKDMVYFELTEPMTYDRLSQAQKVKGVARAEGLIVEGGRWRGPANKIASVVVIGWQTDSQFLSPGAMTQGSLSGLKQPYSVAVDKTVLGSMGLKQVGDKAEIGSLQANLVGLASSIQSSASSPFVLTSLESAKAYSTSRLVSPPSKAEAPALKSLTSRDSITYILVKARHGQNLQALKQSLEAALPNTRAYTRSEMAQQTRDYWEKRTSIGFILGLGAAVGVIVGMVIVGQILYASVSDHSREFGTIRAMGGGNWVAYSIVLEQALWMALLGYLPGISFCLGLGAWTAATQGVLILITPTVAVEVFAVTVVMCVGSALFALQKVTRVDPGVVFRA